MQVASLVFCQVVEQPTQRPIGISPSIATEGKKAYKPGAVVVH